MSNFRRGTWPMVALGELAGFRNGVNYTKESFGSGICIINVKDFKDYSSPRYHELDEINPDGVVRSDSLLKENDLIFVRSNGNKELIGRSMIVLGSPDKPVTHSAFTIRARFTSEQALPRFYSYFLRSGVIRQVLSSQGSGTNISNLNQDILSRLQVPLPPLSVQHRISSILSAYDDLIENNTRRIEILEEMARRLYEEWFVHFRFPGHEAASFKNSDLGQIPEEWACKSLKEFIELAYGKALKKSERNPGPYPVYGSSGEVGTHSKPLVKGPGIILGRKGNVGSVFWTEDDFYPIDTVYFVKTDLPLEYVFFNLQTQRFLNNDAAVPGLNRSQAYSLPFLKPSDKVLEEFSSHCKPIYELVRKLNKKNTNLRAQRDLLLPKLVSGEIDVSEIPMPDDKEVEAA